jgi:hypothetical protein
MEYCCLSEWIWNVWYAGDSNNPMDFIKCKDYLDIGAGQGKFPFDVEPVILAYGRKYTELDNKPELSDKEWKAYRKEAWDDFAANAYKEICHRQPKLWERHARMIAHEFNHFWSSFEHQWRTGDWLCPQSAQRKIRTH